MKVIMINDCASIAETLLNNMPPEIEKHHIKRTRKLLDKTFGIAYQILKAQGDIYHVHYLLQDCYLALRLGKKPLVGSAHGSDLRQQINTKKWGRIVRHNLKHSDRILVSQPTILDTAKKYNDESEYFPIPYDPRIFYEKPLPEKTQEKTVFIASAHDFEVKGTDRFIRALALVPKPITIKSFRSGKDAIEAERLAHDLGTRIQFFERTPHNEMNKHYWESDLVLGSFGVGQLDTVAIEAMACGRPVIHSVAKDFFPNCPLEQLETVKETSELISSLLWDERKIESRVRAQLEYVIGTHSAPIRVKRLLKIYSEIL